MPNMENELCKCANWCRSDITYPYGFRAADKSPIVTNHHPNCDHYNDSLMDVWVATDGRSKYYDESEANLRSQIEDCDEITVEQVKMHKEIYDHLPEFDGF